MKKILVALCLVAGLTACKKSNDLATEPETPKTDVKFTFSDIDRSVTVLGKSGSSSVLAEGDTIKNYANTILYRVFDSVGRIVKAIDHTPTEFRTITYDPLRSPGWIASDTRSAPSSQSFGVINDRLAPGKYTVVFVASKGHVAFTAAILDSAHFFGREAGLPDNTWEDTFHKTLQVTVGSSPITQSVRLDRVVAGLELNLKAGVPTNASRLSIAVDYENNSYYTNTGERGGTLTKTKNFMLGDDDKGVMDKKFLMHIMNVNRKLRVTIKTYDAQNNVLSEKVVPEVMFYANKKTTLSGNLTVPATFSIAVNPTWNATNTVDF